VLVVPPANTGSQIGIPALLVLGILIVLAAVVGSGGKLWKYEFPPVKTLPRQITTGILGICVLLGVWYWDHQRTANRFLRVTGARLTRESPRFFKGKCPHEVEFSGLVSTNGGHKGNVTYRWKAARGGGAAQVFTAFQVLTFDGESGKPIANHLTVHRSEGGKVFIKIISPNSKESNRVEYSVICT
jgi:hypothetical protein